MKYSFTKVLILRPQARLLVLINDQLKNLNWCSVSRKKQALTAYIVPDIGDDFSMLMNLETHYLKIFRNELAKIVGQKNSKKLKVTFFDFLNCFKFEWVADTKSVSGKFIKKFYLRRQNVFLSIKDLSVGDICRILDETDVTEEVLTVTDLSRRKPGANLLKKLKDTAGKILQKLKTTYCWHCIGHVSAP